jgi:hypothetical protein
VFPRWQRLFAAATGTGRPVHGSLVRPAPGSAGPPPFSAAAAAQALAGLRPRAGGRGDAPAGRGRSQRRRSTDFWIVAALVVLALLSRVYTTNSLAGEPTSDEYLYAIHARDIARGWAAGEPISGAELADEGRSVAVESAALSFVVPWDVLTLGRTIQALVNALCIPLTFVLARAVGLPRAAGAAAALLLLAVPEFQESAWRFWTDSQATLLTLLYLTALVAWCRRPGPASGLGGIVCLALMVVTKESAAVTLAPFLVVAAVIPLGRRLGHSWAARAALALLALAVLATGLVLVRGVPPDLARLPLLQRTFGSAPLITASVQDALPRLAGYPAVLAGLLGLDQLSIGLLWAAAVGYAWLLAEAMAAVVATASGRTGAGPRALAPLGWVLAAIAWAPAALVLARGVGALRRPDPWWALAAAALLVLIGTAATVPRRPMAGAGWGLALLGLVVATFFAERLVISVTPLVANAALTFRSFMPTIPLLAIVAGGGLWAAAGALRPPAPRPAAPVLAALATVALALALVAGWSPLVRERTTTVPLLGRVADRGADPDTPQGLRVQVLVEAQDWLRANLRPTDVIITGIPRHLSWYADLGVDGMANLIDLGSQPERNPAVSDRAMERRREYIADRVGPTGAAYVVDFNVNWTDPGSDDARQWQQTYAWLASQPNLEVAYLRRDKFGNPVFYVIRNHGYAEAPGR